MSKLCIGAIFIFGFLLFTSLYISVKEDNALEMQNFSIDTYHQRIDEVDTIDELYDIKEDIIKEKQGLHNQDIKRGYYYKLGSLEELIDVKIGRIQNKK